MQKPLLTVVIPVYNVEKYLRECLDSIVNQTYQNLEIIIVNDCSPDNSEEIILEYQAKDSRVKYIKHEKNLGLGGARNTGITNATGEWITFVDSDDYIDLDTYECMMDLILKNNVDMGAFGITWFDDDTKKRFHNEYHDIPTPTKISVQTLNPSACNKIYRLSDITNNHLTYPEHLKFEDLEFWWKYSSLVEPTVIGTPKILYHYRQRQSSIMGQINTNIVDMAYIIQNIYNFLIQKNIFDKYQDIFFDMVVTHCSFHRGDTPTEPHIKLLTVMHDFLQQFSDNVLSPHKELLCIKNSTKIDSNTVKELENMLPTKIKIKRILKKILKKLHLFEFVKKLLRR